MRIPAASLAAALAICTVATAQSPLTTLFNWNNGGAAGWTMYFDLQVNVGISITQLDVNNGGALSAGSIDVYYKTGTYVGFDTNPGAWTLGSNAPCTGAAVNTPTACLLTTPFTLAPGNYGIAVVHNVISPYYTNGNGTAVPGSGSNQTYSNSDLTLLAGASAGGGLGTAICCTPRVFNGSIYYSVLPGYAGKAPYGTGCYNAPRSFYENFATAAAFDLANSSLSMIYNGSNGYLVLPGISSFVAPSGSATTVAVGDDIEQTVTLGSSLSFPGGSTSALSICSNGFISAATGNGTGFTPSNTGFIAYPQASWSPGWHDFNPTLVGSGPIQFEEVGSISYVTWNGVWDYAGTSAANASTMQVQFDRGTGNVHMIWQGMSTLGNGFLTGFKGPGTVIDPTNRDISATLSATFQTGSDLRALALDASARPIINTSINLVTTNVPANSGIGANILSFTQFNPGLDLTGLGMPGCRQYVNLDSSVVFFPSGGSGTRALGIPNNAVYSGLHVYSQSAAFSAGVNALGVESSNGLDLLIGVQ